MLGATLNLTAQRPILLTEIEFNNIHAKRHGGGYRVWIVHWSCDLYCFKAFHYDIHPEVRISSISTLHWYSKGKKPFRHSDFFIGCNYVPLPSLEVRAGWVIIPYTFTWIWLLIHALIPMLVLIMTVNKRSYSISHELCTRFCCALLCCCYSIVYNEFTWSIYPYSSGLLCWHWGNR